MSEFLGLSDIEDPLPILYSRTTNGNVQQWQIFVEDNKYYTVEGIVGGKLTIGKPTEISDKNVGKKNESVGFSQALKEAKAKHKKKIDSGYRENIVDIDHNDFFEPMLAKTYGKVEFEFPVYTNPKLDGTRCIVTKYGMFSRNGKPTISAPHIFESLKPLFEKNPNLVFDGELYNHDYKFNFNKIISLSKKTKPTLEELDESKNLLQYHIYDLPSNKKFGERYIELKELLKLIDRQSIHLVEAKFVDSQEELDFIYGIYLEQGFEGQIIRLDFPYENKRSKFLLKRKEFLDEEFVLLDITDGKGQRSGIFARGHFKTKDGIEFEASARGNEELYKEWYVNKHQYIGKPCTVRFQNWTPGKVPRFPVITEFARDDL